MIQLSLHSSVGRAQASYTICGGGFSRTSRIASVCLELAKKITADREQHVDPYTCQKLIESSYVDDWLGGGSPEQIEQMKRERGIHDGEKNSTSKE